MCRGLKFGERQAFQGRGSSQGLGEGHTQQSGWTGMRAGALGGSLGRMAGGVPVPAVHRAPSSRRKVR